MEKVVVFDFDGTLVQGESFFPYLWSVRARGLLKAVPELVTYPFNKDRVKLKEAMIEGTLGGMLYEEAVEAGERFYQKWVVPRLKGEIVKALQRNQKEGFRTILVSANITPVILSAKKHLGFDEHLCSELELDKNGKLQENFRLPTVVEKKKFIV